MDAISREFRVEVDEVAKRKIARTEVGEELGFVDIQDLGDRLEFHHHDSFHKQVDPLSLDRDAFVNNFDRRLLHGTDPADSEFMKQGLFVH